VTAAPHWAAKCRENADSGNPGVRPTQGVFSGASATYGSVATFKAASQALQSGNFAFA